MCVYFSLEYSWGRGRGSDFAITSIYKSGMDRQTDRQVPFVWLSDHKLTSWYAELCRRWTLSLETFLDFIVRLGMLYFPSFWPRASALCVIFHSAPACWLDFPSAFHGKIHSYLCGLRMMIDEVRVRTVVGDVVENIKMWRDYHFFLSPMANGRDSIKCLISQTVRYIHVSRIYSISSCIPLVLSKLT